MSQAGVANLGSIPPPPGSMTDLQGQDGITVPPNGAGILFVDGAVVAAGTNPFHTTGNAGTNTETWNIQLSQAIAATDATKVGLSNFNSAEFTVDANGFVSLAGGGLAVDSFAMQTGTSPVVPTGAGLVTFNGATVAAGTNPVRTDGTGANTMALEVQISQAIAATDATKIGLSNFNSAQFTVDANGFVGLKGSSVNPGILGVHPNAISGAGTDPTIADASGNISILGATVAAGTNPVRTVATAANSLTTQVQISQAIAATDATKIGLAAFSNANFAVDANGFVTLNGAGVGETITGDSGGALSPTAGNWNIFGRSGSKTSGTGSTLTVNSPPFSQVGASATSVLNSGEFVTAAVTRTLPATAGLLDGDLVIYYCTTAGLLVVTANTGQTIRIGTLVSSSGGTATSSEIGDSLTLRFDATAVSWRAVSVIGTWVMG